MDERKGVLRRFLKGGLLFKVDWGGLRVDWIKQWDGCWGCKERQWNSIKWGSLMVRSVDYKMSIWLYVCLLSDLLGLLEVGLLVTVRVLLPWLSTTKHTKETRTEPGFTLWRIIASKGIFGFMKPFGGCWSMTFRWYQVTWLPQKSCFSRHKLNFSAISRHRHQTCWIRNTCIVFNS